MHFGLQQGDALLVSAWRGSGLSNESGQGLGHPKRCAVLIPSIRRVGARLENRKSKVNNLLRVPERIPCFSLSLRQGPDGPESCSSVAPMRDYCRNNMPTSASQRSNRVCQQSDRRASHDRPLAYQPNSDDQLSISCPFFSIAAKVDAGPSTCLAPYFLPSVSTADKVGLPRLSSRHVQLNLEYAERPIQLGPPSCSYPSKVRPPWLAKSPPSPPQFGGFVRPSSAHRNPTPDRSAFLSSSDPKPILFDP